MSEINIHDHSDRRLQKFMSVLHGYELKNYSILKTDYEKYRATIYIKPFILSKSMNIYLK